MPMSRVRGHHLALLVVGLVVGLLLVSASAYAGQQLAKNSVGSLQVRNNSLVSTDLKNRSVRGLDLRAGTVTSREVKDGSLARADLARTALADTRVIIRQVATGDPVDFFSHPELGTLTFDCGGVGSISTYFDIAATATPASANVTGSDIADNLPHGGATITAPAGSSGGGVGYGGAVHTLPEGHFFVTTRTATMHAAWTATTGATCVFRVELTIDRTAPTGYFPRSLPGQRRAACSAVVGDATCRVR